MTGRTITSAAATAIAGAVVPCMLLVEMHFDSGTVYVTNAGRSFTWSGHTWLGVGGLGSVDVIEEGANMQARGIRLSLSGVDSDNLFTALAEHYQGRACKIWLAFVDAAGAVIADPLLLFSGRIDQMAIELGPLSTVTLSAESRLMDLERARIRRYSHEDQQLDYPGDLGLEYVALMVQRELPWGVGG